MSSFRIRNCKIRPKPVNFPEPKRNVCVGFFGLINKKGSTWTQPVEKEQLS